MATALLTPETLERHSLIEVDQALLPFSFRDFIRPAMRQYLPAVVYLHNWHIDAYAEHLQAVSLKQIKKLIISGPPRHLKSAVCGVLWPTWHWTRWPSTRFLMGAYKMDLSVRDAVDARALMETSWYQDRWGCRCGGKDHVKGCTRWGFASDQNVKSNYVNDRGGKRLSASVEAGTTGDGGDILGMDDPIDIMAAQSEASRQHAWHYFSRVWAGRRNNPDSPMVVWAQRTNQEDVTGHLLAEGGWEHLVVPTEYKPKVYANYITSLGLANPLARDPRTEDGALLHEERVSAEEVRRLKADPYAWASQHQQIPQPEAGGFIKRAWFRFWIPESVSLPPVRDDKGIEYVTRIVPTEFDQVIQSWDCSKLHDADNIRKKSDSDPVSGGVWARDGADFYLLDRVNGRMDLVETCDAIHSMTDRWPTATAKLIEYAANGPSVIAFLRRTVSGLIPTTPEGSKVARVMTAGRTEKQRDSRAVSMVALFNGGNVYIPHPAVSQWSWEFLEQLVGFPTAPFDDDVDMASQALMYLQPKAWQEQDAEARAIAKHGPPATTTHEIVRRGWQEGLEAEKSRSHTGSGRMSSYRRARG